MKSPLAQNTTNSARDLAQKIARQVAQEPFEVLKDAGAQVVGKEFSGQSDVQAGGQDNQQKFVEQQKIQDQMKSGRQMEALNRELEDIRKQKLFKEIQEKIALGEFVPLEDYPQFSLEQKQVLKAQMEAVKVQQQQVAAQAQESLPVVASKPSRRFGSTQKQEAQKQQTHIEKPVPPSG